jgi:hypothetical protein
LIRFLFDHLTSAAGGYALGLLTAAWLHAAWKLWFRPHDIRVWGGWSTRPRYMAAFGGILALGWATFFVKSLL